MSCQPRYMLHGIELAGVAFRVGVDRVAGEYIELAGIRAFGIANQDAIFATLLEPIVLDTIELRAYQPQCDRVTPVVVHCICSGG